MPERKKRGYRIMRFIFPPSDPTKGKPTRGKVPFLGDIAEKKEKQLHAIL